MLLYYMIVRMVEGDIDDVTVCEIGTWEDFRSEYFVTYLLECAQEERPWAQGINLQRCYFVRLCSPSGGLVAAPDQPAFRITDMVSGHHYFRAYVGSTNSPSLSVHRDGAPAVIFDNGIYERHRYMKDGELHRLDGPADVVFDKKDGFIYERDWWQNGEPLSNSHGQIQEEYTYDTRELLFSNLSGLDRDEAYDDPQP